MIRNRILTTICCFAPLTLAAQAPPSPPAPPAFQTPPAPPARAIQRPQRPQPPQPPEPFLDLALPDWDANIAELNAQMAQLDAQIGQYAAQVAQEATADVLSGKYTDLHPKMLELNAKLQPFALFQRRGASSADRLYERGQSALDRSQWNDALAAFTEAANLGGTRADGALYWKAYCLNKLGRRDEAQAAIADLRKTYASSRWLDDANALEMEIKQASGQNVSPENQPDEELKLMALNALVNSDPDRAVPLLENLLKSSQSLRLKERALFVLAQSNTPRAQQLLEQIAKGGGNPDLQLKAIQYLGTVGRRQGGGQALYDIYTASTDDNVRRATLRAMLTANDTDHLVQAAKSEKSPELKAEAIRYLAGKPETGDGLVALYSTEQDQQVKRAIVDTLQGQRNVKALVDLARKERDPEMKRQLVQRISTVHSKDATDYLMELLK